MSTPSEVEPAKNSTRCTLPSASLALAVMAIGAPALKLAPAAGAVSETLGGWFSLLVPQAPRSVYQPQEGQWVGGAFQIGMLAWYRRFWWTIRSPGA